MILTAEFGKWHQEIFGEYLALFVLWPKLQVPQMMTCKRARLEWPANSTEGLHSMACPVNINVLYSVIGTGHDNSMWRCVCIWFGSSFIHPVNQSSVSENMCLMKYVSLSFKLHASGMGRGLILLIFLVNFMNWRLHFMIATRTWIWSANVLRGERNQISLHGIGILSISVVLWFNFWYAATQNYSVRLFNHASHNQLHGAEFL